MAKNKKFQPEIKIEPVESLEKTPEPVETPEKMPEPVETLEKTPEPVETPEKMPEPVETPEETPEPEVNNKSERIKAAAQAEINEMYEAAKLRNPEIEESEE